MSLRIVLFGTGEFALPTFETLIRGTEHEVVAVYTQPDRTGRGHHRHVNKVKQLAVDHDIPVHQPSNVNLPEELDALRNRSADVFVVAAYGQILKPEFLAIPDLGAFNLHGSLLPRHRGAAPVQYSIWKGDANAGVTMFQIEPALDSGPMIGKVSTSIAPHETSGELMIRLADLSVHLTLDCLRQLEQGTAVLEKQDETQVTLAPKIRKEDGEIDWSQSAEQISCQIRAMQPWPKASTWLHTSGRAPIRCILLNAEATDGQAECNQPAGKIIIKDRQFFVGTGSGVLKVNQLQPQGKKAMDATAFVNGYGIQTGSTFELSGDS